MNPRVPDQDLGGGGRGPYCPFLWDFFYFEADTLAGSSQSSLLLLPSPLTKKEKKRKKKYKDGDHENEDV